MAHSFKITDGTTSIQVIYDASTQANYRLFYGASLQAEEPRVLWHQPDQGERLPVRADDQDRTVLLAMDISGSSNWDTIFNKIHSLKRMVDGASSQALRYWTHGDVSRVYLEIQIEGATNATRIPIKSGIVDDAAAFYSPTAVLNTRARAVGILLRVSPYSEGVSFTLDNEISTAALDFDSGTGLCENWNLVSTPATTTIDTTNYLINAASQLVTGDSGEGLESDTVSTGANTTAVAYVWAYITTLSKSVSITLWDNTASAAVQSKTLQTSDAGSVSDKTVVDTASGQTWYRVVVSGSYTAGNDLRLRVTSQATGTTFHVDGAYLELATTTAPSAWISSKNIDNRSDQTTTNPTYINFVDVWGVPGDSPALIQYKTAITASSKTRIIIGRGTDGRRLMANQRHWIEDNDSLWDGVLGAGLTSVTSTADAARTNGNYYRMTEDATPGGSVQFSQSTLAGNGDYETVKQILETPRRVFVIARTDAATATDATLQLTVYLNDGSSNTTLATEDARRFETNNWQLLDLGTLEAVNALPDTVPDTSNPAITFTLTIAGLANGETFDIDAFWLPYGTEFITAELAASLTSGDQVWLLGDEKNLTAASAGIAPAWLGSLWQVEAGNRVNRFTMLVTESDNDITIGDTMAVTMEVIPRSRHLLGTL